MSDLKNKQADVWASRTAAVEEYWNAQAHITRCEWFAKQLIDYKLESVFEIGIMGGRNIYTLKKYLPTLVRIGGIDVNEASVEFAKEKMPDGTFLHQSVYEMDTTEQYDMVFSAGVFIHIPPDGIDEAIQKCIQKAKRYVMHMEGLGADSIIKGPAELKPIKVGQKFQWRPDLVSRYQNLGFSPKVIPLKHTNSARDLSHLIIINVEKNDGR